MSDACPDAPRILVDGRAEARVSALDRGLAYGDGLFETIGVIDGRAPLWPRHMARLAQGCRRLGMVVPDEAALREECRAVAAGLARAVVRITWTRGAGARGYAPPPAASATRVVAAFPAPRVRADWYRRGMRVRLCATRLAAQPRLAGLKHLNRLEQVLARAEWQDDAIDEGLVCDVHDRVIGATAANLFALIGGRLVTPALGRCGVAGVMRAELIDCAPVDVRDLSLGELREADEVFLSNAVRGVVPVGALDELRWSPGPLTRDLIERTRACTVATGACE